MSLTLNVSLTYTDGRISETFAATQTATNTEKGYLVQVPTLGTASSQISTATLSTLGYSYMRSLVTTTEATCTITFGKLDSGTMHDVATLRPGEIATLRLASGDYAAKAADEGYQLLIAAVEE